MRVLTNELQTTSKNVITSTDTETTKEPTMKVLMVGATGKYASLVVPELKQRGVTVRALVRNESKADAARQQGADEVAIGNLDDPNSLRAAAAGVDGVLHLFDTSLQGLSEAEAKRRLGKAGLNEIPREKPIAWCVQLLKTVTKPLSLLLIALATISLLMGSLTATVMGVGMYLPFSPIAVSLGLVPLPAVYFLWLALILTCYCVLTQFVKTWFIKKYGYT